MDGFSAVLNGVNGVLWHPAVLYALMAVGLGLTIASRFIQARALTHGVAVVAGKYDHDDQPGAISHFQALSAALSATVGVGNIGGTALAIALGGPGAVFWMWVVGLLGMALKSIEVSLSMLYRDISDPEHPHGGPMHVARKALAERGPGWAKVGKVVAAMFCVTLLIATFTGGNFFQAWNAATVAQQYWGVPGWTVGLVLAVLVGAVILNGIRRIGKVAGALVPGMCAAYLLAAAWVLVLQIDAVPATFALIFEGAFAGLDGVGAFAGGTVGLAFSVGLQRALFSNEAGQGSSPIAHSAARTDVPVREGVVAGLEPFIDTLIVCTVTALVILVSGAWSRAPDLAFVERPEVVVVDEDRMSLGEVALPSRGDREWVGGDGLQCVLEDAEGRRFVAAGTVRLDEDRARVEWTPFPRAEGLRLAEDGLFHAYTGAALTAYAFDLGQPGLGRWLVSIATWLFALSTMISWSYYGEQGVHFLFGARGVLPYKLLFCGFIVFSSAGIVTQTATLNQFANLGTGVMLMVNVPLMLFCAPKALRALRDYFDSPQSS